ncbi:hypothetical protein BMF94_5027 [Rhodotorula taiwanensis]|uniref:ABC transporter domain-containing protein n=1 Tax=Rhodotorula taiwanensis TaxID=741276 RepID=A0A2S5B581_9BASI|nr:hypothetical protein BMF94_5027 [Rhodotorula taiwanensis]
MSQPKDVEAAYDHHDNDLALAWSGLTVTAPKRPRPLLGPLDGQARAGELLAVAIAPDDRASRAHHGTPHAVMGPSGAGKSTFLDAICQRTPSARLQGQVTVNGSTDYDTREMFSFVEQDDALLGVLTVKETVTFAAHLALGPKYPNLEQHIDSTLQSLGLASIANNRIGTPLQRGISGGQKRRVTIACSVVAKPRVLVLDEPTSGLDATSGKEVVAFLRRLAKEQNVLVVCTIHQPNFDTFSLFDRLLLLAGGRVMYDGETATLPNYLASIESPVPEHVNPADHAIELVNTEFLKKDEETYGSMPPVSADDHLNALAAKWTEHRHATPDPRPSYGDTTTTTTGATLALGSRSGKRTGFAVGSQKTVTLMHRTVLNYSRNLLAYGIRLAMYVGMGLMLATIWVHLGYSTNKLNDRLSVSFFSVAFLAFMSVAGIPAFLEERAVFIRERANGLYTPGHYHLATTLVSMPFLFFCALFYTLIIYWAIPMNPGATHFFRFLLYLFLALFAAESQSLLIAALVPVFVAALALASFANGLWMCVQGYFIRATSLPRFWYYTAHFIDYQTFSFDLLVRNDFAGQILPCPVEPNGSCLCPIPSSLVAQGQCAVTGEDVLQNLGIAGVSDGLYIGIMLIIILVYRLLMWLVLILRKR